MSLVASRSICFSSLGRRASPPTIARLMTAAIETPGLLSLAAGFTDNGTLPVKEVAEHLNELRTRPDPEFLQYGTNQGRLGFRQQIARRLRATEPGWDTETLASSTLVTNGSQQALYLAVQVLCEPGDIVLVDRPSYFVFLEMLAGLGVQARSLPMNDDGRLDSAALEERLQAMEKAGELSRLRAVYLVSYFSNPSARSLSAADKQTLARALARRDRIVPIIEDAAYRELYFRDAAPHASVLSLPEWAPFPRLYLSTFTKSFATGLKVGYGVCTDEAWLKKMLHVKAHHDFGTANLNQALIERVLENGDFDRQLERIRTTYAHKCDVLHAGLLDGGLVERGWRWEKPAGGLYLWLQAPSRLDTSMEGDFCRACLAAGVMYVPGDLCFGDAPPRHFARLSFGVLAPAELIEAARRFSAVVRDFC